MVSVDVTQGARHGVGVSITAIVENGTIKLPVYVPDGTRVEVMLPDEAVSEEQNTLDWMKKFARREFAVC